MKNRLCTTISDTNGGNKINSYDHEREMRSATRQQYFENSFNEKHQLSVEKINVELHSLLRSFNDGVVECTEPN